MSSKVECLFGFHDWEPVNIPKEELLLGTKRGTRDVCSVCGKKRGHVMYTIQSSKAGKFAKNRKKNK